ncbi:MAG: hypothetical protein MUP60_02840 [Candidatus Thorarchaeota archaeon]|nr:hypothetical protein [Candidatus Thorarchaeota archaeon]
MQVSPTLDIALIGMPGLLLGLLIGYVVGGMPSFRLIDRIVLGIFISGAGGLVLSLAVNSFILISSLETMFIILAFAGGYGLGLFLNWESPADSGPKYHIVYEPDDDDAFDREIEEALGSKE